MDIDEIVTRKNELADILNDEDETYSVDEQKDAQDELDEIEELERELGCDVESAARNGAYFIHEADFEDYAREFAYDIGRIDDSSAWEWPYNRIDWEAAANDLRMDYTEIEWQGETYLTRDF